MKIPHIKDAGLFVLLAAILVSLATFVKSSNEKKFSVSWNTMGTVVSVSGENGNHVEKTADEAKAVFGTYERLLSAWNENSELRKISKDAGSGKTHEITPSVSGVYKTAFEVMKTSGGAFNPLIGNVMKLWGFNGGKALRVPAGKEIANLPFSPRDVFFDGARIRLEKKGMSLDLGAIAKGAAVDRVAENVAKTLPGAEVAVNLGGNVKNLGKKPRKIGVRNPFGGGYAATLVLSGGEAVATSGNYERFVEMDGVRYAHIFDGRTGSPVTNGVAAVTVVSKSATLADALSTTLFVLGPKEGSRLLASRYPDVAALWISVSNEWTMTPQMEKICKKERQPNRAIAVPSR